MVLTISFKTRGKKNLQALERLWSFFSSFEFNQNWKMEEMTLKIGLRFIIIIFFVLILRFLDNGPLII